jgi:hypothetical protein
MIAKVVKLNTTRRSFRKETFGNSLIKPEDG